MGTPDGNVDSDKQTSTMVSDGGVGYGSVPRAIGNALGAILALLLKVAAFGAVVYLSAYMAVRGFEDALDDAAKARSQEVRK